MKLPWTARVMLACGGIVLSAGCVGERSLNPLTQKTVRASTTTDAIRSTPWRDSRMGNGGNSVDPATTEGESTGPANTGPATIGPAVVASLSDMDPRPAPSGAVMPDQRVVASYPRTSTPDLVATASFVRRVSNPRELDPRAKLGPPPPPVLPPVEETTDEHLQMR